MATHIRISERVKRLLTKRKTTRRESYSDVILKLLVTAIEEDKEEQERRLAIKQAEKEISIP